MTFACTITGEGDDINEDGMMVTMLTTACLSGCLHHQSESYVRGRVGKGGTQTGGGATRETPIIASFINVAPKTISMLALGRSRVRRCAGKGWAGAGGPAQGTHANARGGHSSHRRVLYRLPQKHTHSTVLVSERYSCLIIDDICIT